MTDMHGLLFPNHKFYNADKKILHLRAVSFKTELNVTFYDDDHLVVTTDTTNIQKY